MFTHYNYAHGNMCRRVYKEAFHANWVSKESTKTRGSSRLRFLDAQVQYLFLSIASITMETMKMRCTTHTHTHKIQEFSRRWKYINSENCFKLWWNQQRNWLFVFKALEIYSISCYNAQRVLFVCMCWNIADNFSLCVYAVCVNLGYLYQRDFHRIRDVITLSYISIYTHEERVLYSSGRKKGIEERRETSFRNYCVVYCALPTNLTSY